MISKPFAVTYVVWIALTGALCAQPETPKHLEVARDFIRHLAPGDTEYRHKDTAVRWKGVDGAPRNEARTDCSGFLDALLAHSYGLTRDDFKKWTGRPRSLANTYHNLIDQGKGFTKVANLKDVRPGDIIAVHYPAGAADTGHVMLVSGAPTRRVASAPFISGAEQWEIRVIDCTRSGHGPADSRRRADGTFSGGVGEGIFRLYTDSAGHCVGYAWSTFPKSDYYGKKDRPLLIGRLNANFAR